MLKCRTVLDYLYLGWSVLLREHLSWRHPLEFGFSRTVQGGWPLGHRVTLHRGEWPLQPGHNLRGRCWLRVVRRVLVRCRVSCGRLRGDRCFVSVRRELEPVFHYLLLLLLEPFLDNLLVRWARIVNLWGSSLGNNTAGSFLDSSFVDGWIIILFSVYNHNIDWSYSLFSSAVECVLKEFLLVRDFELSLFSIKFADDVFHVLFYLSLFFDFHFFLCIVGESLFLSLLLAYQYFEVVKLRRDKVTGYWRDLWGIKLFISLYRD